MRRTVRRHIFRGVMVVVAIGVAGCGSGERVSSGAHSNEPSSTESQFAGCPFTTYPGGTFLDENGVPVAPKPGPPPPRSGDQVPPGESDSSAPPGDPEVPPGTATKAKEIALSDRILGSLLREATLVDTLPWLGQDDEPIGVILDYRLEALSDLPMSHGEIISAPTDESLTPGKYEKNGLPSKRPLGEDQSLPGTGRAWVYVDTRAGEVYATQPMDTLDVIC